MPAQEIIPSDIALNTTLEEISAQLPATLGAKTGANSLSMVLATDGTLPLPSGAATETTLDAINDKTPALGTAVAASSLPVVLASDQELVETLQAMRMAIEVLAAQSSRFMPDVSGRNRVAIESGGVTISSGTVTTVTTTGTLTNQTNMGGLAANPQIPYLMMLGGDNLRRNITVS